MAVKEETMRESLEGKKREWGDTERVLMGFFLSFDKHFIKCIIQVECSCCIS